MTACGGDPTRHEHTSRTSLDLAVAEAINRPNGGDYARAVQLTRSSDLPAEDKRLEIGQLIVGSFRRPDSRRPPETLQEGLALVEAAAMSPWPDRRYVPQDLRAFFRDGVGSSRAGIPVDHVVADCWEKLEDGRPGDPARCVTLRRQRLPQLSP